MKRVMVLIASSALLGLSSAAIAQSAGGGMSGGGGASIGPAPGTPGNFTRPRGVDATGSGVTGRMPDANRSDNDQIPGNRRPPVQPPARGVSNGSGAPGAESSTPAPIIVPPSPFGAR